MSDAFLTRYNTRKAIFIHAAASVITNLVQRYPERQQSKLISGLMTYCLSIRDVMTS